MQSNLVIAKIKRYLMIIGAVLLAVVVAVPLFMWWLNLRKNGKTLSFTPEFKVIDIKNENQEDLNLSKKTVKNAKKILEELNKVK